ncbi:hypothetical protein Thimo_1426 [Thioflavicoccus mobilis 8321]|uniref:Secreted protein n=1 Tax=Thioflavicoccus mobilis 8321 TaxID=765912 RepID=L0GTY0_9GAMM|nr:hypothetical protein [Thioflavicoccus mobilis]AGA90218.1 hypothetical protein Thimo_1426 [Thioflavicoccus mobilis 8321]
MRKALVGLVLGLAVSYAGFAVAEEVDQSDGYDMGGSLKLVPKCDLDLVGMPLFIDGMEVGTYADDGCPDFGENNPGPWPPLVGEEYPSGEMRYSRSGPTFRYVLFGKGLERFQKYTLIYYQNPWGNPVTCLGKDMANWWGMVYMRGDVETGSIPKYGAAPETGDANAYDSSDETGNGLTGAKIWLVPSGDVDCEGQAMTGWNPSSILFEYDPIVYIDTDPTPFVPAAN